MCNIERTGERDKEKENEWESGRWWFLFLYHFYWIRICHHVTVSDKNQYYYQITIEKRAPIYVRNLSLFNHFHLCYRVSSANTYAGNAFLLLIFFCCRSFFPNRYSYLSPFHSVWMVSSLVYSFCSIHEHSRIYNTHKRYSIRFGRYFFSAYQMCAILANFNMNKKAASR